VNKVALVTGSSSGIGRAIAVRLAREGATVAVNYSKSQERAQETVKEINSVGGKAIIIKADVTKATEVDIMVTQAVKELGKLNILVNNAGVFIEKPFEDTSEQVWDTIMNVNLKGPYLCSRRCVPELLKQGGGKIINLASIDSFIAEPNATAYCASKAGVVGFTTALAYELAPKRINVNAIAPGQIDTPMIGEWLKNPETVKALISKTPYGRIGKPTDIAAAAAFLASDESEFVNGVVLTVDGGWLLQ
jgi:NAD(P)-dependent dehydrogenase (short-subunit alcohol dehydrogenase family)